MANRRKECGLEGWMTIVRVETSESTASEKERESGTTENGGMSRVRK